MRTLLCMALPLLLVTACSKDTAAGSEEPDPLKTVPCALAGSKGFTAQCGMERSEVDGKSIITLRHPDGGFRRLVQLDGAKRYAAADGSDDVEIELNGAEIEVTLGEDHYLMPGPGSTDAGAR